MSSSPPSRKKPPVSFLTGFLYTLKLWAIKSLTSLIIRFQKTQHPPTLTKIFDPSSALRPARIFFPPNTDHTSAPLPTVFSLHGGGFAIGHPKDDDETNTRLAANGILVIALSYPLAPSYVFPAPLAFIASQMQKALADPGLPIDASRIGLIGFSAGGNLALAVAQLEETPKVKATIAFFPPVDFMQSQEERLARRVSSARGEKDLLASIGDVFEWGYIPAGTPLDDPGLSPRYAKRSALSEWLFVVAPSHDMLCNEAGQMVAGWLGEDWGEEGRDEMVGEGGKIRWLRVNGQKHAFTQDIPPITAHETAEARKERKQKDKEAWEAVGTWLMEGPFKR